jgi:hypothetical protein
MAGIFGGIIAGLVVALLLVVGGTSPVPTIAVAIAATVVVWLVYVVVARYIGQRTTPQPRFVLMSPETVSWTTINGTRMSWCRLEVRNDGAPGTVGVQLVGVTPPDMRINGLGHLLRGLGRPATEDGNVRLAHGQRQKFDLFWMGKLPGPQYNIPQIWPYSVAARLVKTELEAIRARVQRLELDPVLTEDYLLPTTEWVNRRGQLAQTTAYDQTVAAYREVDRVNDQWRWRKEGAKGRIAANLEHDGLKKLDEAAVTAIAALARVIDAGKAIPPGPRRLFTYGVCLKDGGQDLEPVTPLHRAYTFHIEVVGGAHPIRSSYEVCISAERGTLIQPLK